MLLKFTPLRPAEDRLLPEAEEVGKMMRLNVKIIKFSANESFIRYFPNNDVGENLTLSYAALIKTQRNKKRRGFLHRHLRGKGSPGEPRKADHLRTRVMLSGTTCSMMHRASCSLGDGKEVVNIYILTVRGKL